MTDVKYFAPYRDPSGYGMAARNYIMGLDKLGVNVEAIPKGFWRGDFTLDGKVSKKLDKLEKNKFDKDVPLISHQVPTHFNVDYPGYKIGYTVHETTLIVNEWKEYMNRMDEIWTASKFSKKVFIDSGVTVPIEVIPHGIDRRIFNERVEPLKLNIADDTFKFLSVFQWTVRKGFDILLKSYYQEFTLNDNVALIIKTFGYSEGLTEAKRIQQQMLAIQAELQIIDAPPVYLLFDFYNYEDLARLYKTADAFVLPSRGEAWGIPYLEAQSCGTPVIATRWSGQLDFLDDRNAMLIELDEVSVVHGMATPWFTVEQRWAEPCKRDLRSKMRTIFENDKLRAKLSRAGIKNAKMWPWKKGASIMLSRLEEINSA